ncbi:DUF1989 domain-containing protein [Marinicrinis sediminis]|uniref:DUF1989 domain-containing protein n=1 Tax=Marinicrinis sediminis TaxID=1652465 RepID=A0ABW5RF54_9BACL
MTLSIHQRIPARTGAAFHVKRHQRIRVIDVSGEQVADFTAFYAPNTEERLDPLVTIDVLGHIQPKIGDALYSNQYRPMLTFIRDDVGRHDLLYPACRPEMYKLLYDKGDAHPNCYDNLNQAIQPFGIAPLTQHHSFNVFMNVQQTAQGALQVVRPLSKAGDQLEMRAEMDLIIAISACPTLESPCNGYHCTDIVIEIE